MIMNKEAGSMVKKQTVADDVLDRLSSLANVTEELSKRVESKLNRICSSPMPTNVEGKSPSVDYPPYFAELRAMIDSIYSSVYAIRDVIDRTEI